MGCRVNQYETQGMREILEREGVAAVEKPKPGNEINFVVINTCTVTAEADKENKYWIRRARREHPEARIVVTGCGVERNRSEIEALPEVDLVLANHEKAGIAGRLLESCASPAEQDAAVTTAPRINPKHVFTPLSISQSEGKSRAFVKIQDGCNHACSFCKVVMVRGRSRSRGMEDLLDEVRRLANSGYKEIVFAGIQLGAYGLDLNVGATRRVALSVADVIEESSKISGVERIRLSSIEPTDVKPDLIKVLRDNPKACHHLHIPLQSGDDTVLKGMNRRHGRQFYIDLAAQLREAMPDFSLTMDVMAGFPGESDECFENTYKLIETVKPLKCHVFPYSRREGTRAANFTEEVLPEIKKQRVQRLIELSDRLGREARLPYIGKRMDALVEVAPKKNTPLLQALTRNYLKVCFQGMPEMMGKVVPVELLTLQGDLFLGKAL